MQEKKLIDLDTLFKSKNPGLYRWIPSFVMRYLKRVIHQDHANQFLLVHANDDAFQFSSGVVKDIGITFDMQNMDRIPKTGGCILACNHPMGALEGMCLISELQKVRTDIKFIVNDLLLNLHNLREIFAGVNKHGKSSADSLKMINDLFSSEQLIVLFPAGLVSRKYNGVVEDLEWRKTFITRARKYNKPVIPVYIHAQNSNFFYRLSNFRRRIGIKANIEMFYLVDEMYKQKGKHISIVFGKLIEPTTFTKLKTDEAWAREVRQEVYRLKEHLIHPEI